MALPTAHRMTRTALPTPQVTTRMALPPADTMTRTALPTPEVTTRMALPTRETTTHMAQVTPEVRTSETTSRIAHPTPEPMSLPTPRMALPTQANKATIHNTVLLPTMAIITLKLVILLDHQPMLTRMIGSAKVWHSQRIRLVWILTPTLKVKLKQS